jgi:hypothetical protein
LHKIRDKVYQKHNVEIWGIRNAVNN